MRILIATHHRTVVGGAETYLRALIPALLERGHQIAMLYDYRKTEVSGPTVDLPECNLPIWYCEDFPPGSAAPRDLKAWRPDVVYSHGINNGDADRMLQESYPTVLYAHAYWGTCVTGRKCHSFPTISTCTRELGPACLMLHYPRRCGGLNPFSTYQLFREQMARKSRLPGYQAVLAASTHMYAELQRNGVSADRLRLLRLPITNSPSIGSARTKTTTGRLLFLGRLVEEKGADFLIRSLPVAQRLLGRKLTVTIAGDGSQLRALQNLAASLDVAAEFTGWVDGQRKLELLRQTDLLVAPSLWPEPFGLIGIEAGSLGVPAVGFAVGGIPDWLISGRTGELAPGDPPTPQGLAEAIARALKDEPHYQTLRQGAMEFSDAFSLERHVADLETILHGACPSSTEPSMIPVADHAY